MERRSPPAAPAPVVARARRSPCPRADAGATARMHSRPAIINLATLDQIQQIGEPGASGYRRFARNVIYAYARGRREVSAMVGNAITLSRSRSAKENPRLKAFQRRRFTAGLALYRNMDILKPAKPQL